MCHSKLTVVNCSSTWKNPLLVCPEPIHQLQYRWWHPCIVELHTLSSIHTTYIMTSVASWQRDKGPLNFNLSENLRLAGKFSLKNTKFGAGNPHFVGAKSKFWAPAISCRKFAAVCRKTATSWTPAFLTDNAAARHPLQADTISNVHRGRRMSTALMTSATR